MAIVHWKQQISGDFGDAANWRGGKAPGAGDDAVIAAAKGAAITVSATADETVRSLRIGKGVTVEIASGTFTDLAGTGGAGNAGKIAVDDGASFALGGMFVNHGGVIVLDGGQHPTTLVVNQAGAVVDGGQINLGASSAGLLRGVYGGSIAPTLTNAATILGTGTIDNLAITNVGLIDAAGYFPLSLTPGNLPEAGGSTITNAGTLEASNRSGQVTPGGLALYSMTIANMGVVEAVGVGTHVDLFSVTLQGGTLRSVGGGVIASHFGRNILDGRAVALTNLATVEVSNAALSLEGAIVNGGGIDLGAAIGTGAGSLDIVTDTTLTGGGRITLSDNAYNAVYSATGATLTNVDNTIAGAGSFDRAGPVNLSLVNEARGVVDANGTNANGYQNILFLNPATIVNAGVMESTNQGQLIIVAPTDNNGAIKALGGILRIIGPITGSGQVIIGGGTLDLEPASSLDVAFKGGVGVLQIDQSQAYSGTVTGFSRSGGESLHLTNLKYIGPGEASYTGNRAGGVLIVSDGTHTARINLRGDYLATAFTTVADRYGKVIVEASAARLLRFVAATAGVIGAAAAGAVRWDARAATPATTLARPGPSSP